MKETNQYGKGGRIWKVAVLMCISFAFHVPLSTLHSAWAQKPGTTPVKVSFETQMLHGRKYYVHIVEKGQTVYSIAKAYKVSNFDAVTHVDIHSLHPGDTVWLPFRGQFAESEEPLASTPAPTPAPTITRVDTVLVHDTAYVYVHDTTVVTKTVTQTEYVPMHDTTYIDVPYAVHDTTVVTKTVTQKEYVTVHDTTYITVHDTTVVTNTVTQAEYVPVHDTIYITMHDTTVVTNTVTQKEYVPVHDTTYITMHDTTVVTNTVTQAEYVPVHDTIYITVRDTTVVTNTVTQAEYVPVHDTIYITVHDTAVVTNTVTQAVYVPVHDTIYITVHDTTVVSDKVTLTEYVPVHDTTYVNVHDTTYITVHDTTVVSDKVTLTEYVPVHDTTYVNVHDTTYITVHDTTVVSDKVTLTEYVPVHDTTYINVHDTTYITVHDTTVVTDKVTLTEYVPVHDTTYINVHDTTYITVHDTTVVSDKVTLTEYVPVHDTTYVDVPYAVHDTTIVTDTVTLTKYVTVHDTTYIAVHDTTYIDVPYAVHDTTFVIDTVDYASASDLAYASAAPVALTEYEPEPAADGPAMERSRRQAGLKIALMMPLHLNQLDQISTSKFDIEQRGKKSYRQFEFIEFYEGILLALDRLAEQGISVELNVVDVSENNAAKVEEAFISHNVAQSDFVVALLLRDAFDKAAELAQQAGVYIVNPMATRTELCAENPYMVKVQPSVEGMISLMLKNMKVERPDGHLYVIYSNSKAEKAVMDELKRQLDERQDIPYTLFNWSQSAKLAGVLKKTPNCHVLSIFDQDKDNNRVFVGNLLNHLAAFKSAPPTLYTLSDWTRDYNDVDFAQLQQLNYHTFSTSWDMTNDVHVNFLQAYRTRFGSEPSSPLAAAGYDLMLYIGTGLSQKNNAFWQSPGNSLPTLIQPLHLSRHGAGLENDKAQLYRLEGLKFVKASYK